MAVNFTEAEWLIMSSLGYVVPEAKFDKNGNPLPNQTVSVSSLLDSMEKQAKSGGMNKEQFADEAAKKNYLDAIKSLRTKLKEENYIVSKCINHNDTNESGLVTFAIESRNNVNNEVIICCRGSDGMNLNPFDDENTLNDWLNSDVALAWDTQTQQQKELEEFMRGFEKYDSIYLTGHSLGGNLAMYGAVSFPYTDKIAGVYSFDGPGFNPTFIAQHIEIIEKLNDRIYNFQNEHDLVSSSLISIGHVIVIASAIKSDNVLTNHNRWSLSVNSDGTLKRNRTGQKDIWCNLWHDKTLELANNLGLLTFAFSIKKYFDYKKRGICRDFSEHIKEVMVNAAKEVEDEHWWEVTKWDCWYRVQEYCGFLEWDKYTGNIDKYYRKLIDINDASVKDIEKIFESVYRIDDKYFSKMQEEVDILSNSVLNKLVVIRDSIIPS